MDIFFIYLTVNDPTSSITHRKAHHDTFLGNVEMNIFYTASTDWRISL